MISISKKTFVFVLIACVLFGAMIAAWACAATIFKHQRPALPADYSAPAVATGGSVTLSAEEYGALLYMKNKYDKLEQLEQIIKNTYYEEVSDEELEEGVYRGLFNSLGDVYSQYITADEYGKALYYTAGELDGIGVLMTSDTDRGLVRIKKVYSDSPAEKAGVQAGDFIVSVDGVEYSATQLNELTEHTRGKAGTTVEIVFERDGEEYTAVMTRGHIITETVEYSMLENRIGYIQITSFTKETGNEFRSAFRDLELKRPKGIIIDIRNNGGGIIESGIEVADELLPGCTITTLSNVHGEKEVYTSDADAASVPYVLLVNGNTASTSEILASAIKANEGGALVGTRTYGKGIVQVMSKLDQGDAYRLTILEYVDPAGNKIHGAGVTPDYIVEQTNDPDTDAQLEKAIELLSE